MLNIDFERKSRKLEYISSTLAKETVSLERKMLQRNNQEIAVAPTKTAKLIKKITALKKGVVTTLFFRAVVTSSYGGRHFPLSGGGRSLSGGNFPSH